MMNRRQFSASVALGLLSPAAMPTAMASDPRQAPMADAKEALFEAAASAVRSSQNVQDALNAWRDVANQALPFRHLTALVTKPGAATSGDIRRVFSTIPSAYPVGGWKHRAGSDWSRHVIERQEVLVASGESALNHYFPDNALLQSLGTKTLINIPIVVCRETIGAFAFLSAEESIAEHKIATARALTAVAAPLLLLEQRANV